MTLKTALAAARTGRFRAYARNYARNLERRALGSAVWLRVAGPVARVAGRKPKLRYVEMHVADHCNLNCRGCSHYSPLSPKRFANAEQAERDFKRLAELFASVGLIRLMGGEPLLHPQLEAFITAARRHLPRAKIAVVTNGLLLPSQPDSFWEMMGSQHARLDVTRYPVGIDTDYIRSRAAEHGVVALFSRRKSRFTMVPVAPGGDRDPRKMRRLCGKLFHCPFLRDGAIYPCARLAMSWLLADRFAADVPILEGDRMLLDQANDGYEVLQFLAAGTPWCGYCGSDATRTFDWALSDGSPDEWIVADPG